MTSKKSVNEIIMKKLPEKGFIKNKGIDDTGLHKRPQMMQIVNYLENGQEKMNYPDREAKFVRNHPFMTQLDFFDMQDDQQRAWEENRRKQEAQQAAAAGGQSAALGAATRPPPPKQPPPPPPGAQPKGPPGAQPKGPGGGGPGGRGWFGGGGRGSGSGPDPGPPPPPPGPPQPPPGTQPKSRGGGSGSVRRLHQIANQAELVDPLITDMHAEEVATNELNVINKMAGVASQMTHYLMNRSHVPSAMPDDAPVPTPLTRKIDDTPGPQEQGYGPVREGRGRQFVNAVGLDGETIKHVVGSMASASGSAAAAAGGYIASGASQYAQFVHEKGIDNAKHNFGVIGRGVLNIAAGTASAAASGTGAMLNFAGSKMMANMTEEEYHELEAHRMQVIQEQQTMTAMSLLHENAFLVQEQRRASEEAQTKRTMELTVAKSQAADLSSQDASSNSYVGRKKRGTGRRANLQRSFDNQKPPTHKKEQVRNEEALEGFGRKLARGISGLLGS